MSQTNPQQLVSVVEAVKRYEHRVLLEAKNRKAGLWKDETFYSLFDLWMYKGVYSVTPGHEQCPYCQAFDNHEYSGTVLRSTFPDHLIFNGDKIYVNYHQTLWGKDTCKCYLFRVGSKYDTGPKFPLRKDNSVIK